MDNKWIQLLGLAKRAGKVVIADKLEDYIRKGKVFLLIISENSSANTKKKWYDKVNYYKTSFIEKGLKEQLGKAIGKNEVSAIGIIDKNLAVAISLKIKEGEKNGKEQL